VDILLGGCYDISGAQFTNACDSDSPSFVSTGSIPIRMDKYNKKIMIVTIRDPDLFRVEN
jgi:hypothetical protein